MENFTTDELIEIKLALEKNLEYIRNQPATYSRCSSECSNDMINYLSAREKNIISAMESTMEAIAEANERQRRREAWSARMSEMRKKLLNNQ